MEKLLQYMQNDTLELDNTLSKEEEEKISKELRKLGYIKWNSILITQQYKIITGSNNKS